jgi:hypothetical protein
MRTGGLPWTTLRDLGIFAGTSLARIVAHSGLHCRIRIVKRIESPGYRTGSHDSVGVSR